MAAAPSLKLVSNRDPRTPADHPPPVLSVTLDGMSFGGKSVLGQIDLALAPGETVAITGDKPLFLKLMFY